MNADDFIKAIKPKFGAPCNHCGLCCSVRLCPIGEQAFPGQKAPCPALVPVRPGLLLCKLVLVEEMEGMQPLIRVSLGIGAGCSMPDDDTTPEDWAELDRRGLELVRESLGDEAAARWRAE